MSIPFEQIYRDLKAKKLTRINQLFLYAPLPEWKEAIGLRKGVLERLLADPKRIVFRYRHKIALAIDMEVLVIENLILAQETFNANPPRLAPASLQIKNKPK